jgi:predicted short-subunit dehydrogenase-like oxidoreductase (DUF2520 family)
LRKTDIAFKHQIIGSESKHIVLIGAGNVATHLARHLYARGHRISCVWSRTPASARALADTLGAASASHESEVPGQADFYLVAVPDDAVAEVAARFTDCAGIWLHAAGSLPMDVFKDFFPEYGVFYPLQTLSKASPLSPGPIPILVEGSSEDALRKVRELALSISQNVEAADSATRLMVHLAAVFANNFSTHMEQDLSPKMLDPLLEETFQKIISLGAGKAQTGPAVRGDQETMKRHREMLKNHPEWEKLYTFISREIVRSRES